MTRKEAIVVLAVRVMGWRKCDAGEYVTDGASPGAFAAGRDWNPFKQIQSAFELQAALPACERNHFAETALLEFIEASSFWHLATASAEARTLAVCKTVGIEVGL